MFDRAGSIETIRAIRASRYQLGPEREHAVLRMSKIFAEARKAMPSNEFASRGERYSADLLLFAKDAGVSPATLRTYLMYARHPEKIQESRVARRESNLDVYGKGGGRTMRYKVLLELRAALLKGTRETVLETIETELRRLGKLA